MTRFLLRRLLYVIPILLGVSVVVFVTIKIIPGDPVASLVGPGASTETRREVTQSLGLDRSLPVQYAQWLGRTLTGDFGTSIAKQTAARPLILDAFWNTLVLTAFALAIALLLGLLIGGIGAARPHGWVDRICSGISVVAAALPQYSVALVFIIYLAVGTGWFPVAGMHTSSQVGFGDLLHHAFLPALTAALVPAGVIARIFRGSLGDVLQQDFVEAMRARGVPQRRILAHAVHNTLPPLLTVAGLQVGYLLGGVVFVETLFTWPGLGLLVYQSISTRDLPIIQAGVLVSALAFVLVNLLVDLTHALIDPRVRTS